MMGRVTPTWWQAKNRGAILNGGDGGSETMSEDEDRAKDPLHVSTATTLVSSSSCNSMFEVISFEINQRLAKAVEDARNAPDLFNPK
jgi:hypothetical protein